MAIPKERPESPPSHKPPARRQGQAARSSLSATSPLPPWARTRRVVSWLALGLAGAEVIVGVVGAVAPEPPGSYTGWGEDLTGTFITVVPLVAVGLALRSSRRGVARTTAVMALILAALFSVVMLGYLFWGHDWSTFTLTQKTITSLGIIPSVAVYLAAFLAGLPAFGRRWPVPPDG